MDPLRVRLTPGASSSSAGRAGLAWDEVRPAIEADGAPPLDEDPHAVEIVESTRQLLIERLGLASSDALIASRWVRQSTKYFPDFARRFAWHYDYGQHAAGVYSAILYLGHEGEEPLVGGHTAFADTPPPPDPNADHDAADAVDEPGLERLEDGSAYLHRGLTVAPRIGRLVLFSGGSENYHAPMPVLEGRRQSLQMWFRCGCES